jgi:hypothetical protein
MLTRSFAALALACVTTTVAVDAADAHRNRTDTFRSAQAISYQLGSKRAIGYFVRVDGKCQVTLMIAEAVDPDVAQPTSAAKLSLAMMPGQKAGLASEEGELELTCGSGAESVLVTLPLPERSFARAPGAHPVSELSSGPRAKVRLLPPRPGPITGAAALPLRSP